MNRQILEFEKQWPDRVQRTDFESKEPSRTERDVGSAVRVLALAKLNHLKDAYRARALLDANDIKSFIVGERFVHLSNHNADDDFGADIQLKVCQRDAQNAARLLQDYFCHTSKQEKVACGSCKDFIVPILNLCPGCGDIQDQ